MKNYITPEIEIESYETVDIIASSSETPQPTTNLKDPYQADKF